MFQSWDKCKKQLYFYSKCSIFRGQTKFGLKLFNIIGDFGLQEGVRIFSWVFLSSMYMPQWYIKSKKNVDYPFKVKCPFLNYLSHTPPLNSIKSIEKWSISGKMFHLFSVKWRVCDWKILFTPKTPLKGGSRGGGVIL